ncbi:hypothetical protein [Autumnicola musiva]|uniref:Uncharacterized protein n=1 Tax=Autumnicola musiva TaxID=3075589 RepID=A0ABU3D8P0_9FLAO|nr:hypothetical protein [Zunongwangia sp. F117]MDT0677891.1 hypothetical protein [Zunongwangia sp. F117]
MKLKNFLIVLALIGNIFYSCDSDDLEYQNEFEASKNVWLEFKESSGNSYQYTVVNGSWVGFSWETTITVESGEIIQRHFEYTSTEGLSEDIPESELQWTEAETEIGTHHNGAEPMTIDEIYNKAEQEWLIERGNATIYFENENNGIISNCGYVEDNCADDCFIGITIDSIKPL